MYVWLLESESCRGIFEAETIEEALEMAAKLPRWKDEVIENAERFTLHQDEA
jgi:hypothetical protein